MAIPKSARWDPSKVMGSNCMINMVTGPRSLGKTYAMKKCAIKQYIKKGETWSYVRYNDKMIQRVLRNRKPFIHDIVINEEFPDYLFRMDGAKIQIAEKCKSPKFETFGQLYSLTAFDSYKGSTTPDMSLMVLDEFIKEKRVPPYPPDTVGTFFNMWETFDRREDRVRVVMLANAADLINPFFKSWNITPIPKGTTRKFKVGNSYVLYENAWSADFESFSKETNIGKYSAGSDYESFAVGNDFENASGLFVCDKPNNCSCHMSIIWGNINYGVWRSMYDGIFYVDDKPNNKALKIVLTKNDMMPNYLMIEKSAPLLKQYKEAFMVGALYFKNDYVRETFLEMLKMCGLH